VVIGRPRVGKTRFVEALAAFLGAEPDLVTGPRAAVGLHPRREASAPLAPLAVRDRHGRPWLRLIDTASLREDIPERADMRRAMALALTRLQEADVVFHLLDAAQAGRLSSFQVPRLDREVRAYALTRPVYVVIATKADAFTAAEGVRRLRAQFPSDLLIPVSNTTRRGLREVRRFLATRAAPL